MVAPQELDFSFSTSPKEYGHIDLSIDGPVATIALNIDPQKNLRGDTPLKLNSYDLGVDIELADAINRIRFCHPKVEVVTFTSANEQIFSSGANIYMLKKSSHAFKVNFCKFTNETRLYIEETSKYSNKKFLCALNGSAAGGGYELALACDRIILVDDKNASVSLPEVPLLGVLPGTGGLTRVVDKRKIRKDLADVFCSVAEGVKGKRAVEWGVVDAVYPKSVWHERVKEEEQNLRSANPQPAKKGIHLSTIEPKVSKTSIEYSFVRLDLNSDRTATLTINGPKEFEPSEPSAMMEKGTNLWILKAFRELDDALLRLRFFYRDTGLIEIKTKGDAQKIISAEAPLYDALNENSHWFLRELVLHAGRVFKRLDTMSRSIICTVTKESCFSGIFAEFLLCADRTYGLIDDDDSAFISLSKINGGPLLSWTDMSRLSQRFYQRDELFKKVLNACTGEKIPLEDAQKLGLITYVLDDIDFEDELRVFKEERAAMSPDALSAMEANLRFNGPETMATKIFGRLSAWQNWVFIRNNATGERGALMSYGEEQRPQFNFERC